MSTPIASIEKINLTFGEKQIFKNAKISVFPNDKVGLLGLNGSGKSTLLKILAGELNASEGEDAMVTHTDNKVNEKWAELIPQQVDQEKEKLSIIEYFYSFYPDMKRISKKIEKLTKIEKPTESESLTIAELFDEQSEKGYLAHEELFFSYLKQFNLSSEESMSKLSGGMQKKVHLSLGLSSPCPVILWDEPTNHLDLETITFFEQTLQSMNKAFILVAHDRSLLSNVCNKIFNLQLGEITAFQGGYLDFLDHLDELEEQRQKNLKKVSNILRREQAWMRQGIKARGTRSKKRVTNFNDLQGEVATLKQIAQKELDLAAMKATQRRTKQLIELDNLSFGFTKDLDILDSVSLTIQKGDKIALTGPNGAGKTTLLNIISGRLKSLRGTKTVANNLKIGHIDQNREKLKDEMTLKELLTDGTDQVVMGDGSSVHVSSYLESFLFKGNDFNRPIYTFSGGEKNRLHLANELKNGADLWILDEPTNDLDLQSMLALEKKLEEFEGALILVSHDRTFLSTVTNKCWYLDAGKLSTFSTGFAHAYQSIEVIQLEKELALQRPQDQKDKEKHKEKKLSWEEKKRIKELPGIIKKSELRIEKLISLIDNFDYEKEKPEIIIEYSKEKDELEMNLLELYEEEESLIVET